MGNEMSRNILHYLILIVEKAGIAGQIFEKSR